MHMRNEVHWRITKSEESHPVINPLGENSVNWERTGEERVKT